jgi:hypothetical protein
LRIDALLIITRSIIVILMKGMIPLLLIFVALQILPQFDLQLRIIFIFLKLFKNTKNWWFIVFDCASNYKLIVVGYF